MPLKKETTCKCIKDASMKDTARKEQNFHTLREYQVDVIFDTTTVKYKVYQNGGTSDFVVLSENDFMNIFKLIDCQ